MRNLLTNLATVVVSTLLAYGLAEVAYSSLYIRGIINPPDKDGWFFREAGDTIQFDPVMGYKLTPTPSPMIRITHGEVEYRGVFRGNNQGFQDRDDFVPERTVADTYRIAVLGDSFSSGQFLDINWPDRTEDLLAATPGQRPVQLLNFSLYSGGLANWRNILLRHIEARQYAIDLLLFPVYGNDLFRPFMMFEGRDTPKLLIGRAGWDPAHWPETPEQARPLLTPSDGYNLTAAQWEGMHAGRWHPELPRPTAPYFAQHVALVSVVGWSKLQALLSSPAEFWAAWRSTPAGDPAPVTTPPPASAQEHFTDQHLRLIEDIRAYSRRHGIPVLVVRIPDKGELVQQLPPSPAVVAFARQLDATLVDAAAAYGAMSPMERGQQYFPVDPHWNQGGSDRFAHFMARQLTAPETLLLHGLK